MVKQTTKNGKKGSPVGNGTPGPGRPKGSANKTTALLKDAILKAAEQAGNKAGDQGIVSYLEKQAEESPGPFMSLLGKVLPMQVEANVDGQMTVTFKTIYESKP